MLTYVKRTFGPGGIMFISPFAPFCPKSPKFPGSPCFVRYQKLKDAIHTYFLNILEFKEAKQPCN